MPRDRIPRKTATALGAIVLALAATAAPGATWRVARGPSAVGFSVSHLIFSEVEGRFRRFSGTVELPGEELERAVIEADIDVASIHTGHEDRDRHLLSDEFLDADNFPSIRFVGRSVRRTGAETYEIRGDLTIRGVTREIVLAAISKGRRETTRGPRLEFTAAGTLNRYDYGLRWNRMWDGSAVLGEEVEIRLEVCLVEEARVRPAPLTPSPGRR